MNKSKRVCKRFIYSIRVLYNIIMFLGSYQNVDVKPNQELLAGNRFECVG